MRSSTLLASWNSVAFCYWLEVKGDLPPTPCKPKFHIHSKHNRHCDREPDEPAGSVEGAVATSLL